MEGTIRLLEGDVESGQDLEVAALREELRKVQAALLAAQREARHGREEMVRALSALRRQLSPLYRALQAVFGELDAAGIEDMPTPTQTVRHSRVSVVWESWKSKLGAAGKLIDALLVHGELNTQQLAIATGLHRTTIPKHIYTLNKAGLLNKNGGRFSLKEL